MKINQLIDEEYISKLEKQWREANPKIRDKEWLEIFPEFKEEIPKRIRELEKEEAEFSDTIKKELTIIKYKVNDEFSKWFWREWVKASKGQKLLEIEERIAGLKRLLFISKSRVSKAEITDEMIQQALNMPIENLLSRSLKKSGKALVGLCPFHQEKTPSFFIYPKSNSFYCFGCNRGGNVINFVRLLYGYSFKEAVKYLTGEK